MAFATSQNIDQLLTRGLSFRLPNNAPISSLYTLYANGAGQTYWSNSINPTDLSTLSTAIGDVASTVSFQGTEIADLYGQVSSLSTGTAQSMSSLSNYFVDLLNSTIEGLSTFSTFYADLFLLSNATAAQFSSFSTLISAQNSTQSAFLTSTLTSSMNGLVVSSSTGLSRQISTLSSSVVYLPSFYSTTNGLLNSTLSTSSGLQTNINANNVALSSQISTLRFQMVSTDTVLFSSINGYGNRVVALEGLSTNLSSISGRWISSQVGVSQSTQDAFYNGRFSTFSSLLSTIAINANAQFGSLSSFSSALYSSILANTSTNDAQSAQISTLSRNLSILTTSSILANVYDTFIQLEAYTTNLINSTISFTYYWQSSLFISTLNQNASISQAYFSTFTGTAYLSTVSAATALTNVYVSTLTGQLYISSISTINNLNSTAIGVNYSTGYSYLLSTLNSDLSGANPLNSTFTMPIYVSTINTLGNLWLNTLQSNVTVGGGSNFANVFQQQLPAGGVALDSWKAVACDSNGNFFGFVNYQDSNGNPGGEVIFKSPFSGIALSLSDAAGFLEIAMSADGLTSLVIKDATDQLQLTTDQGNNWTAVGSSQEYIRIAMTPSGQYMYATTLTGNLYYSSDFGATWGLQAAIGFLPSANLAISNDGVTLFTADGINLKKSTNSGLTWTTVATPGVTSPIISLDITGNAQVILFSDGTDLRVSLNGGTSFSTATLPGAGVFNNVALSKTTGQYMLASDNMNNKYIRSFDYGANFVYSSDNFDAPGPCCIGYSGNNAGATQSAAGYTNYLFISLANDLSVQENKIGINTSTPQYTLDVSGVIFASSIVMPVIRIGSNAASQGTQGLYSIAIGDNAGLSSQTGYGVAIGASAGQAGQGAGGIAIGSIAGADGQGAIAIAIGQYAGTLNQGEHAVAIGVSAGQHSQGSNSIAIGSNAGGYNQTQNGVAIGTAAGFDTQLDGGIAIGYLAGSVQQKDRAVAIGLLAGCNAQGCNAIAIGTYAGADSQGSNAIAIGFAAGSTLQVANSIIINASNAGLAGGNAGFYVNPVRNDATVTDGFLHYDTTTKEIVYNSVGGGGTIVSSFDTLSASTITGLSTATRAARFDIMNVSTIGGFSPITFTDSLIVNGAVTASTLTVSTIITTGNVLMASASLSTVSASEGYFSTSRGLAVTGVNVYGVETARTVDYNNSYGFTNLQLVSTLGGGVNGEGRWSIPIGMSADGKYAYFGKGNANLELGYIYRSADYGSTINQVTSAGQSNWNGFDCSRSGQIAYSACGGNTSATGRIFKSTDYGLTWSALSSAPAAVWTYVSCTGDGRIVSAVIGGFSSNIYMSYDFGATFTTKHTAQNYAFIATSITGQYISVSKTPGVSITSDYGNTWADVTGAISALNCVGICMSADGQYQMTGSGLSLYYSSDFGASWTAASVSGVSGAAYLLGISCDDSGQYVIASIYDDAVAYTGAFVYSSNYGQTYSIVPGFSAAGFCIGSKISGNSQFSLLLQRPSVYRSFLPTNFPAGITTTSSIATAGRFNIINASTIGGFSPITFTDSLIVNGAVTASTLTVSTIITIGPTNVSSINTSSITSRVINTSSINASSITTASIDYTANAVRLGASAGLTSQGVNAVSIGLNAGSNTQGNSAVALGVNAGTNTQGLGAVAIGSSAASTIQGQYAVSIGLQAGRSGQGSNAVALGLDAGQQSQQTAAIAIGWEAGYNTQNTTAIAIGNYAGRTTQGANAIAIGSNAGSNAQGSNAIAIGRLAAETNQGAFTTAIGNGAGQTNQGPYSVAVGNLAGNINQNASSIAINATTTALNPTASGFHVNPVRQNDSVLSNIVHYDFTNKEFVYNNAVSSLGIGTSNPSFQLQLSTDSAAKLATNTWTISSDERIKKNIVNADLTICLSTLKSLPLRYFEWNEEFYDNTIIKDRHNLGFIAQEVKHVFPKAVDILPESMGFSNFHTLNVDQIYKAHIGATQRLSHLVEIQQSTIYGQQAILDAQQSSIEGILARI